MPRTNFQKFVEAFEERHKMLCLSNVPGNRFLQNIRRKNGVRHCGIS